MTVLERQEQAACRDHDPEVFYAHILPGRGAEMTDHHPEALPALRAELVRAVRDHDRARRKGQSLVADGARERMQAYGAAMTALRLDDLVEVLSTQPAIDFDTAVAEAQRLTVQEAQ